MSITAVYDKLNGLETGVSQALVAETGQMLADVLAAWPAATPPPIPGLRLRTLDGNFLAGTEHRLEELRASGAAALPGMSLVVREGRTGLLTDLIPCEDAYTKERSLYPQLLPLVQANDLWLADRNFCTQDYLDGIAARQAFFLIPHHAGTKLHPLGKSALWAATPAGTCTSRRCASAAWCAAVSACACINRCAMARPNCGS